MKVLHVIPSLSPVHGGPTHALAAMERALAAQGITVETATTDDDGPGRHNGKRCGVPLPENGAVRRYFRKQLDFYKPSLPFARWIGHEVRQYDVVHIHALFSFLSTVAARAARRAGVPYVIRPLGTLAAYGLQARRPWLKRLSMRCIEAPLLRDAAAVHFTSEAEAAEARELGIPMREAVVPLGVEVAAELRNRRQAGPVLRALFLSRLDPKKNVEGLLDATALLKGEALPLHLTIAGGGAPEYVASLKARAATAGLAQQVDWLGHVDGPAKAAAFADADVFVLPSFSENFGIAAAEALAAGLPCVLGKGVAIAAEVAQAGAGLTVNTDAHSIAGALRRIIADKPARQSMSDNAWRLAGERFSMQAMGANLKRLYTDVLNQGAAERKDAS